jgi:hypothetical protein
MLTTTRLLHRMLVDRIAALPWLRGRSGPDTAWAHYERHAKASRRAADRHAQARAGASARAGERHAHAGARARRLARRGPPRVLPRWQASIGRIAGGVRNPRDTEGPDCR